MTRPLPGLLMTAVKEVFLDGWEAFCFLRKVPPVLLGAVQARLEDYIVLSQTARTVRLTKHNARYTGLCSCEECRDTLPSGGPIVRQVVNGERR